MSEFIGVSAPLYNELISKGNILIAGMTGSGKSTFLAGLINSILYRGADKHLMVLIDPKKVEFIDYEQTIHCIRYVTEPKDIEKTLEDTLGLILKRFDYMKSKRLKEYDGTRIHLFVDEMADLMLTSKKSADLLQRICQIGRAAGVQVILATQCPLREVIPTRIKVNFPIVVGLHTQNAQQSRNILGVGGCESLPMYGEALILYPSLGVKHEKVPKIPEEWLCKIIEEDKRGA